MEFLGLTSDEWVSGATVVGVLGAVIGLIIQLKSNKSQLKANKEQMESNKEQLLENKKSRSAQMAHDYSKNLLEKEHREVSRIIDKSDNNKTITIDKVDTDEIRLTINTYQMDNYLSELETISLFINDEVIDVKYGYELFGDQINAVFENNDTLKYMNNCKVKPNEDAWDNLFTAHDTLIDYKNKKLS